MEFEEEAILEEIPAKASIASIELEKFAGRPKGSSRGEKLYRNNTYHDAVIEACRRYILQKREQPKQSRCQERNDQRNYFECEKRI